MDLKQSEGKEIIINLTLKLTRKGKKPGATSMILKKGRKREGSHYLIVRLTIKLRNQDRVSWHWQKNRHKD